MRILALAALLGLASPGSAASPDPWSRHITEASSRFDIPADWIRRVIRVESGGRTAVANQPIVSPAGAMGLMQLMPGTWREMRVRLRLGPDPFNPRDNILAGTAYLRMMYDRFGYPGLFAAYNAGPARFADVLRGAAGLPAETRTYIARVLHDGVTAPATATAPKSSLFAVPRKPLDGRAAAVSGPGSLFVLRSGPR